MTNDTYSDELLSFGIVGLAFFGGYTNLGF